MLRILFHFRVLLLIGVLSLVLFLILFLSINKKSESPLPQPTASDSNYTKVSSLPTPSIHISDTRIDNYSETYQQKEKKIETEQKTISDQQTEVGALLKQLPYSGSNFRLEFTFKTNDFILTINKAHQAEGEVEFQAFLKKNGIENSNWIQNLITKYE